MLVDRNQFLCFSAAQRFEAICAVARLARVEFMAARDIGLKNKSWARFSSALRRVENIVQAKQGTAPGYLNGSQRFDVDVVQKRLILYSLLLQKNINKNPLYLPVGCLAFKIATFSTLLIRLWCCSMIQSLTASRSLNSFIWPLLSAAIKILGPLNLC